MNASYYFGNANVQTLGTKEIVAKKKRNLLRALNLVLENGLYGYRICCQTPFTINGVKYAISSISTVRVKNTDNYVFLIQGIGREPHTVTLCDNPKIITHITEEIEMCVCAKKMRKKQYEDETFEQLYKTSPFMQMNIDSRQTMLQEIREMLELLENKDKNFLNDCFNLMEKLSGEETAAKFVEFMKTKLEEV